MDSKVQGRHSRCPSVRRTRTCQVDDRRVSRTASRNRCRRFAPARSGQSMSALRVLHLGKYYAPERGGIETVVETLCRGERPAADTQALVLNKANRTVEETLNDVPVRRVASIATLGSVSVAPML